MANVVKPPVQPPVIQPGTGKNIIVNPCQRGNPIIECIKNVGKEFGDIKADYQVGRTMGVLFLSLKYHQIHAEYIHQRIEKLEKSYNLRILLLMCDVSEHQNHIRELTKICLVNNITIIVAWSNEEAGFYLSTFKMSEHKSPDLIKERVDKDYNAILRTALTSISKVNKTDVETLKTSLGSVADIAKATSEQLQNLPGFGQVKVKRIKDAFEKPFRNNTTSALSFLARTQAEQSSNDDAPSHLDKGKGREPPDAVAPSITEASSTATTQPHQQKRPARQPSPDWASDLELRESSSPAAEMGPPLEHSATPIPFVPSSHAISNRQPSPVWDLELELNPSDEEPDQPKERDEQRNRVKFGNPGLLS